MKKKIQTQLDRANKMYAQLLQLDVELQDDDKNEVAFEIAEAGAIMQQVVEHLENAVKRINKTI